MIGLKRYLRDPGYFSERLGNAVNYLIKPEEFFWKQKAKKEAAACMEEPNLRAIQDEAKRLFPSDAKEGYEKYTDFKRYFAINFRRIYRLKLPARQKLRVLDIGCGGGFFALLCKRQGHDVTGMDVSDVAIFNYLIPQFGIPRITHMILPQQPLPPVEARFHCITAFAICFHELEGGRRWSREDWLFFLDDVARNVIEPGGRMHLFFNDWPHGDFQEVKSRILPCPYEVRCGHKTLDIYF